MFEHDDEVGRYLGRGYMFNIKSQPPLGSKLKQDEYIGNQCLVAAKTFAVGLQLHKQDHIRYPYHTRRVVGRVKPGEVQRQGIKTS